MSHSKTTKKGRSLFVEKWNAKSKNFINTCIICGKQGYNPSINDDGFVNVSNQVKNYEHSAIRAELTAIYSPLPLDELGRCEICARITDKINAQNVT